jgi:predicted nucleotidyltransferase component of viral defense system
MTAKRDGRARSVQVRLARKAKDIAVDPNLLLTRYGVERFLYRLSISLHADKFILKGALLLLAWFGETLRPTRDADLLGFGEISDDELVRIFREVCAVDVTPDAVTFNADSIRIEAIREEDAYGGRRVTLDATLGAARLKIQVDVGIGDAVTPAPQWLDYPSLLDLPRPRLRVYPRETVVAEKLHAMVLLGARNSRMKDYFDLYALVRERHLNESVLSLAIAATFARRRTELPTRTPVGLSDDFANEVTNRARWRAFLTKNRLHGPALDELIAAIRIPLTAALESARESRATGRQ